MPTTRSVFFVGVLAALCFGACGGSDGDPCQTQDDCGSDLMCCKSTASLTARGVCEQSCADVTFPDAGAAADAGRDPEDAAAGDAALDGGVPDSGLPVEDGGFTDGAVSDGALPDGSVDGSVDGGEDAGPLLGGGPGGG